MAAMGAGVVLQCLCIGAALLQPAGWQPLRADFVPVARNRWMPD